MRAALGQFIFDGPDQLLRLLSTMARNKVIDRHRREKSRRPSGNGKQEMFCDSHDHEPPDPCSSPSQVIQGRELLEQIAFRLTKQENAIAKLRRDGCSWKEISGQLGGSADSPRKQLSRACDRVFEELGIDD